MASSPHFAVTWFAVNEDTGGGSRGVVGTAYTLAWAHALADKADRRGYDGVGVEALDGIGALALEADRRARDDASDPLNNLFF